MKYLVIDAAVGKTGIRDKYTGDYLSAKELGISTDTRELLQDWLLKYEAEFFNGYIYEALIAKLDSEGKEIASRIKNELKEVKMEYYSDARSILEII